MVFGRLKDAATDLAETLRRIFQDPPVREGAIALEPPVQAGPDLLEAHAAGVDPTPQPQLGQAVVHPETRMATASMGLRAALQAEEGWEAWEAGAQVCTMPVFQATPRASVRIPALPDRATVLRASAEAFRVRSRGLDPRLERPGTRSFRPELARPRVREALALALAMPVAVPGETWASLGKPQQMRYSLELVKATGENIRNVEVLGLFLIPDEGVLEMRHDPRNQKLLLRLDGKARPVRRRPFLLARRRGDGALVSCFLEHG